MVNKKALIVWGGRDGHTPERSAGIVRDILEKHGFDVVVATSTAAFIDPHLDKLGLIVPVITMSEIQKEELEGLTAAVRSGVGLAGFHGTMCDSFRKEPEYQFMTGGQWVSHPGNIIDYRVNITRHDDPANEVLATTTFSGEHLDFIKGVVMPVVWKKHYGWGRVFYSALGHTADEFDVPEMKTIFGRGALWASR